MEQDKSLLKLHKCQIILINEIIRICKKNNIKCFVIAGTLLGAIRHKGFIPWDDDMDIGMLRDDYELFLAKAKEELGTEFFLQNFETDSNYGLPFSKLLLKDTVLVEKNSSKNHAKKGIYVDIFPYDNSPDDQNLARKHDKKTYFLKRLFIAKQNYCVWNKNEYKKRAAYAVLKFISFFVSKEKINAELENEIQKYNAVKSEKVVNIGGAYGYEKECLERRWFDKITEVPFEDTTVPIPGEYVEFLEYFYGDYMTPPPEDKRYNRHNLVELDFGPYDK